MMWPDRSVLITGATGFLGGWLVKRLLDAGARVVALVRDDVPQSMFISNGLISRTNVVRGDFCDLQLVERALGEYEIETVMHLGAQTIVGIANRNPLSTFESNIRGTWTLLEACRRTPTVAQIVVASSDKAYGEHKELPYDEEMPLQGRHPYDVSKSCSDLITQSYATTYRLPVVITRCGNFYGGGDLNWNRIVPGTIRSIIRGAAPVIRSDGTLIRDYMYIEDAAAAYMLLARKLAEDPALAGRAYNFSNETQTTVLQMVEAILKNFGSDMKPDIRNHASYEIQHQYLSAKRARKDLGWKPEFSLDAGLLRTINWYKDYFAHEDTGR